MLVRVFASKDSYQEFRKVDAVYALGSDTDGMYLADGEGHVLYLNTDAVFAVDLEQDSEIR